LLPVRPTSRSIIPEMGSVVFQSYTFKIAFHDVHKDYRIWSPRLPGLVAGEEINLLAQGGRQAVISSDPFGDREAVQREVDAFVLDGLDGLIRTETERALKLARIRVAPPTYEIDGHVVAVGQRVLVLGRKKPEDPWEAEPHCIGNEKDFDGVDVPLVLLSCRKGEGRTWSVTLGLESDWRCHTGAFQVPSGTGTWQRRLLPLDVLVSTQIT